MAYHSMSARNFVRILQSCNGQAREKDVTLVDDDHIADVLE